MSTKNRKALWAIVAAVFVVIVVAAIAFGIQNRQTNSAQNQSESSPAEKSTSAPSHETKLEGPDGQWAAPQVDVVGRSISVPANGVGNPLVTTVEVEKMQCDPTGGKAKLQLSHGVQTIWSDTQGPIRVSSEGIPLGYARSAEGAMISGWNATGLSLVGGEVTVDVFRLSTAIPDLERVVADMKATGMSSGEDLEFQLAPAAYRLTSCSENHVVGDLAMPATSGQFVVTRISMVWEQGDWKLQYGQTPQPTELIITDLQGWTAWKF